LAARRAIEDIPGVFSGPRSKADAAAGNDSKTALYLDCII